jgi:hypothetical protein
VPLEQLEVGADADHRPARPRRLSLDGWTLTRGRPSGELRHSGHRDEILDVR